MSALSFRRCCKGLYASRWLRMPADDFQFRQSVQITVEEWLGPKPSMRGWRATVRHVNCIDTHYACTAHYKTAKAAKLAAGELAVAMGLVVS